MEVQEVYRLVEEKFACACLDREVRFRQQVNGRVFVFQCTRCGKVSNAVKKASLSTLEQIRAPEIDAGLQERWNEERFAFQRSLREKVREEEKRGWWERYNAYLLSEGWAKKRQRVLERDNFICQACRLRRAEQVHHLTYDHVFHEPLFDLAAVCLRCHVALTQMDRERRGE
jgi:5-methylcytosine-specific restriction endonuclease McrA